MSQTRAKRIRRLMVALGDTGIKAEAEFSHEKLVMGNRHNQFQHRMVNPVRQMKKRVSRSYGELNRFLRAELMKRLREHERAANETSLMSLPPGTPDAGNVSGVNEGCATQPTSGAEGSIPSAAPLSNQQETESA